jgi:hypothetical protein
MDNIREFQAAIAKKGGMARTNRFRIRIPNGGNDISLLCESIKFPSKTISSFDFSSWRNPIKIPNGFSNEDVTAVFHLTNDYYIKNFFDKWIDSIVNTDTYFVEYDSSYKTPIEIYQLDGKNNVVYGVKLNDAYPISIGSIDLDNTATDSTQKLSVDFTYNTWTPIDLNANADLNNKVGDDARLENSLSPTPREFNFIA